MNPGYPSVLITSMRMLEELYVNRLDLTTSIKVNVLHNNYNARISLQHKCLSDPYFNPTVHVLSERTEKMILWKFQQKQHTLAAKVI